MAVFQKNLQNRRWRRVNANDIRHVRDNDDDAGMNVANLDILLAQPRCNNRRPCRHPRRSQSNDSKEDRHVWTCVRFAAKHRPRLFVMAIAPSSVDAVLPLLGLVEQSLAYALQITRCMRGKTNVFAGTLFCVKNNAP